MNQSIDFVSTKFDNRDELRRTKYKLSMMSSIWLVVRLSVYSPGRDSEIDIFPVKTEPLWPIGWVVQDMIFINLACR
jgi:hypothetical protein